MRRRGRHDWNARELAEKVTGGDSGTDAKPPARDSFRYGPDGARYFKKTEWAVGSGATTTLKMSRKYYAGAYEKTVTDRDTVEGTRMTGWIVFAWAIRPAAARSVPSTRLRPGYPRRQEKPPVPTRDGRSPAAACLSRLRRRV